MRARAVSLDAPRAILEHLRETARRPAAPRRLRARALRYVASFYGILGLTVLNAVAIPCIRFPELRADAAGGSGRTLGEIVAVPKFYVAAALATLANSAMLILMSSVVLEMVCSPRASPGARTTRVARSLTPPRASLSLPQADHVGFAYATSILTLQFHFFSMFFPGFFTGHFVARFGLYTVAGAGVLVFWLASAVLLSGHALWNFAVGMVLCGVGWNFCFSTATVMVTDAYESGTDEATRVQGINDFIIFSISGVSAMFAGLAYDRGGWTAVVIMSACYQAVLCVVLVALYNLQRREAAAARHDGDGDDDEGGMLQFAMLACGFCGDGGLDQPGDDAAAAPAPSPCELGVEDRSPLIESRPPEPDGP